MATHVFDHQKLDVYVASVEHMLQRLVLVDEPRYHSGRELLLRIVAMLVLDGPTHRRVGHGHGLGLGRDFGAEMTGPEPSAFNPPGPPSGLHWRRLPGLLRFATVALSEPAVEGTNPGPEEDDRVLLGAIASGDRVALARLYDRYAPMLMAVGVRMLGVRGEAEDLLHDVFLEAWQRASTYDPTRGSVVTWLLVRLRSRALDRLRSRKHSASPMEEPGELEEHPVREEDPALAPDRTTVRRALESLSSEQRVVLELAYFHGLSQSEIALQIGVPIGTVKSRIANGLGKLRAGLIPGGTEGGGR